MKKKKSNNKKIYCEKETKKKNLQSPCKQLKKHFFDGVYSDLYNNCIRLTATFS